MADFKEPIQRLFDDSRRKRQVQIIVTRFWGAGQHYYVSLKEEPNWIVNPEDGGLVSPFDDTPANKGRELNKKFNSTSEAQRWIEMMFRGCFKNRKRDFSKYQGNVSPRWFYKEGD